MADDDPTIRLLLSAQLSVASHEVTTVGDGGHALRALAAATPDLLVLDVMMPVRDGWSVLEQVRGGALHNALPIVLLTAGDTPDDVRRGRDLGASCVLSKARALEQLVDTVDALTATVLLRP